MQAAIDAHKKGGNEEALEIDIQDSKWHIGRDQIGYIEYTRPERFHSPHEKDTDGNNDVSDPNDDDSDNGGSDDSDDEDQSPGM